MMENERIRWILEMMERQQIDLLLLMPSAGMKYALGDSPIADERLFVLALAPGKKPFLLANSLYQLEAAELFDGECVFWQDGEDPYPVLRRQLEVLGYRWNRTAVERSTQAQFLLPLQKLLPGAGFEPASEILDRLRIHKDEKERDRLRKASRLGDEALRRVMERGGRWIGKTEAEFFARLSYEMICLGLDVPDACVCAGANAADPHYVSRQGIIQENSCLLVDFGGTWKHYYTDMTRTFWFGQPDAEFEKVYDIVRRANEAGEAAAILGRPMEEIDRAARKVICDAGYGQYFIHRTGHGVGIDVHESPNAAEGEKAILEPGMAFSVEPGIYLPGRFGVRIEDLVLMTEVGAEVLHSYPKELTCFRREDV